MFTLIEFFEKSAPLENIAAGLILDTDRIIYIGSDRNAFFRQSERYRRLFRGRGIKATLEFREINSSSPEAAADTLKAVFSENKGCVTDTTGGEERLLIALGMAAERCGVTPAMISIDYLTGCVRTLTGDAPPLRKNARPTLTVEENILLHGGTAEYPDSFIYRRTEETDRELEAMWELCTSDNKGWGRACAVLEGFVKNSEGNDIMTMEREAYDRMMSRLPGNVSATPETKKSAEDMLMRLYKKGLLSCCYFGGDRVKIAFSSAAVRYSLKKIGNITELKTAKVCMDMTKNGKPFFDDVRMGVSISWDDDDPYDIDSVNEIDVIAMRGFYPVFISCKNGNVSEDEPYKLSVAASYFGGRLGRKMLVTLNRNSPAFRERAADLGIDLAEGCTGSGDIEQRLRNMFARHGLG